MRSNSKDGKDRDEKNEKEDGADKPFIDDFVSIIIMCVTITQWALSICWTKLVSI